MKTIAALTLVVCLFASFVRADDGEMGNGSRTCTVDCPPPGMAVEGTPSDDSGETAGDTVIETLLEFAIATIKTTV